MPDKPKFSIVRTPKKWLLPSGRYPGKIGRELWVAISRRWDKRDGVLEHPYVLNAYKWY